METYSYSELADLVSLFMMEPTNEGTKEHATHAFIESIVLPEEIKDYNRREIKDYISRYIINNFILEK